MATSGGEVVVNVKADISQFHREMGRAHSSVKTYADSWGQRSARIQAEIQREIAALRRLEQQTARLNQQAARGAGTGGGGYGRMAAGMAAAGFAAHTLGRNLKELGDEGSYAARAGGFLTNFFSGNFVGAVKAAGEKTKFTTSQFREMALSSEGTRIALAAQAMGWDELAQGIRKAQFAMRVDKTIKSLTGDINDLSTALERAAGILEKRWEKAATLPQGIQTALSGAEAQGTKAQQIAQIRRAKAWVDRQQKNPNLDDVQRQRLYDTETSLNAQLAALTAGKTPRTKATKEPPIVPLRLEDRLAKAELQGVKQQVAALRQIERFLVQQIRVEKDINRRIEERRRLRETRQTIAGLTKGEDPTLTQTGARGVFGQFGQGPHLSSARFQFAAQFGYQPSAADYLKDITGQVTRSRNLMRALTRLDKQGAPDALLSQLLASGNVAGAKAIANADPKLRQRIFAGVKAGEEMIQKLAKMEVQTEQATINASTVIVNGGSGPGGGRGGDKFKQLAAAGKPAYLR